MRNWKWQNGIELGSVCCQSSRGPRGRQSLPRHFRVTVTCAAEGRRCQETQAVCRTRPGRRNRIQGLCCIGVFFWMREQFITEMAAA